ncbi:aKG-HExxH-type peptide beta-hydroxylase [Noviherbaspirillum soli]|uniref:aKG-HExxH-type peptide beta-hydroxylase n=1 Tax=Noviherbaspirillum soli TaxID=1064518 RepID=UPI00188A10D8|nr:HEXXH motif-containing putative peptide modification protein [Noviherbaspirillum soli]
MILQFGFESQIDNVLNLIGTIDFNRAKKITTLKEVQTEYHSLIQKMQMRTPGGAPGTVNVITDFEKAKTLRPLFVNDSLLDDKMQADVITETKDDEATDKKALILRAIHELGLYSEVHKALLETLITDIFILPSSRAKAGSTSQAIGVIWANPKTTYSLHDMIEILVHEMTHHAMFIDELRYVHYCYSDVMDKSTWALSAILNVPRPLDKVLHSAVVATEILLMRANYIGHPVLTKVHPPTNIMLTQLKDAIAATEKVLLQYKGAGKIFTERANEIFHNVQRQVKALSA